MEKSFVSDGKVYNSLQINRHEFIWRISDMPIVLKHSNSCSRIIIGGRVFSKRYKRLMYGWNFSINHKRSFAFNVEASYKAALEYVNEFIEYNCEDFYIWFVDADENSWSKI